jgi:tetratricopeptide (TPR) repeat protein
MAANTHLTASQWGQFFDGALDHRQVRAGVRHLLARCPVCSPIAALAAEGNGDGEPSAPACRERHGAVGRLLRLAQERRCARQAWDSLRQLPPSERLEQIEADPALCTFGLSERLIEECGAACWSQPRAAIELARLALAVAARVPRAGSSRRLLADLRGRALACLADARRVTGDLAGAWEALASCEEELDNGTGDPLESAILERSTGDLLLDLWRLDDACEAFGHAVEIYSDLDDPDLHGQTLAQLAMAVGPRDPERAIELLETALSEISPGANGRAELKAVHGKIWLLTDSGRSQEAARLLEQTRRLYRRLGDPPTLTRLHWLEARIAHRLGRTEEAELTLQRLWHRLRDLELPLEHCMLSCDLIEVYMTQGKAAEALPLAQACYPVLMRYGRDDRAASLRSRLGC